MDAPFRADETRSRKILNFERARSAVQGFCRAAGAAEILQYVIDPEEYQIEIEGYFEEHGGERFALKDLVHGQTEQVGSGEYVSSFLVHTKTNPSGFTVMVHETDTGHRISWPAFVQRHDQTFEAYLENRPTEPEVFRVILSRGHCIDPNAPSSEEYDCFYVEGSENARGKGKAYVSKRTLLSDEMKREIEWDRTLPVTARFVWAPCAQESDSEPILQIKHVVAYEW